MNNIDGKLKRMKNKNLWRV